MSDHRQDLLRGLPSVNDMLALDALDQAKTAAGHTVTADAIRTALESVRDDILSGGRNDIPAPEVLADTIIAALAESARPSCRHVINATGVIIHTGLGRSVLPDAALEAIAREARGYCLLETDRETGQRGQRDAGLNQLLRDLTGAESATVVNNNAAATLLCLDALAKGREVVVSRGQLVEIGGSFRIPDIMAHSGAIMREVGATNKTHPSDYENAISETTGLLLRVHTSNYKIVGFAEEVPLEDLVALGRRHHVPVMDDTGSGSLIDMAPLGFPDEPSIPQSIAAGADVVCASGDKLLGACQAGVICGREDLIRRIRRSPLYRAMRVDKLTLIMLETTLRLFRNPETLRAAVPTLRMLTEPIEDVTKRASRIARGIRAAVPEAEVSVEPDHAQVGSGSAPAEPLPTKVVSISVPGVGAEEIGRKLRMSEPPIFTRIRDDRVIIDAKTVLPDEVSLIHLPFQAP